MEGEGFETSAFSANGSRLSQAVPMQDAGMMAVVILNTINDPENLDHFFNQKTFVDIF